MSLPVRPPAPALVGHPLTLPDALAHESRGRLRGSAYRRPTWNVYLAAGPGPPSARFTDHGEAIVVFRAAVGPDAVLGGPSAAWAVGVRMARADDPVEIVLPPGKRVRHRDGLRVRGDVLLPGETVPTPFGPATSPARTAFDLARRGWPDRALAWVDAVLREAGTPASEVEQVLRRHPRVRGVRQARTVVAVADPRAESPRESMLRWVMLDAGLPPPTPQLVVRDPSGAFVARLDFGWPALRVGVEYDGDQHRDRRQHERDLVRHNRLRALGWTVIQIDAAQLRDPDAVIAVLRPLLSRASRDS